MNTTLVSIHAAAEVLGLSPQTLRWRIEHGHLKLAQHRPVQKVRLADVYRYKDAMPPLAPRPCRPRLLWLARRVS
jgi:hypothetical protein